ncbi:uncharacterized protein SPSK_10212 [Sporothrix schenckii 1099-18]|uniref:Uncharacterized protein n=1 Tax=Sporothrix schenckii 1099-18 TaxID=1397361 RepID=A0A0F2M845_SPOSC|nr:uncharacterized protein SPSK_10212 [Sporothrix schenckii 1099-18]KJR84970.1 hypothetical protein SPSK_10212 [Sporothrix schenckii 1099-18]
MQDQGRLQHLNRFRYHSLSLRYLRPAFDDPSFYAAASSDPSTYLVFIDLFLYRSRVDALINNAEMLLPKKPS